MHDLFMTEYYAGYMVTLQLSHFVSSGPYWVSLEDNERYGGVHRQFQDLDSARALYEVTKVKLQQLHDDLILIGWELSDATEETW